MYEQRRRLIGVRRAICLRDDGDVVELHTSVKETADVAAADLGEPLDLTPAALSPAARLLYASGSVANKEAKLEWQVNRLTATATRLGESSVAALRQLAGECLDLGWMDVFGVLQLTPSEKSWLLAHVLSTRGDLHQLLLVLRELPAVGYPTRAQLLLPHLERIGSTSVEWLDILRSWVESEVPMAQQVLQLLTDDGPPGQALLAAAELIETGVGSARALEWRQVADAAERGDAVQPLSAASRAWKADWLVHQGLNGVNVDAEFANLSGLSSAILDDLIDTGAVTRAADLNSAPRGIVAYLKARVAPDRLDDSELEISGHQAERARRHFRAGDRAALESMTESPEVLRYRSLLAVAEGRRTELWPYDDPTGRLLRLAQKAKACLAESIECAELPAEIKRDVTLWSLFAGEIREGRLALCEEDYERFPGFATWFDTQRLLALVFSAEWTEVVRLATELESRSPSARLRAEVLSIKGYAHARMGDRTTALDALDSAVQAHAGLPVLTNAVTLAGADDPPRAFGYLDTLLRLAPLGPARTDAMRRAVDLWFEIPGSDPLPAAILDQLPDVLPHTGDVETVARFLQVLKFCRAAAVLELPSLPDERNGPLRLVKAQVKFDTVDDFGPGDLALEFARVFNDYGRCDWFQAKWEPLLENVKEACFVDFGEGLGAAVMIDSLHLTAPELLTPFDRTLLLPQAGAHMAGNFVKTDDVLALPAFEKFFFTPLGRLTGTDAEFDQKAREFLAVNLARCLAYAALLYLETNRNVNAGAYNTLVQRLRWDSDNRFAILRQMRSILDEDDTYTGFCDDVVNRLRRLPLEGEDRRTFVNPLTDLCDDWRAENARLRRNL